jgi:hypothetical protein
MALAQTTNFVKGFKLWWWALPGSTFEVWSVDGEEGICDDESRAQKEGEEEGLFKAQKR